MPPDHLAHARRQIQSLETFVDKISGGFFCIYAELQVLVAALLWEMRFVICFRQLQREQTGKQDLRLWGYRNRVLCDRERGTPWE